MRVLMVNKFLHPQGGTERVMLDLTAGLVERGHDVVPFGMQDPRNDPTPYDRFFPPSRDYDAGGWGRKLGLARAAIYDREAKEALARMLREVPPDVAHLHNIYHQLSPSILDALRDAAVPVLMTLHDYKLACPTYKLFRNHRPCEKCVGTRFPVWAGVHRCQRGSWAESWLVALESTVHRLRDRYGRGVQHFVSPSRFLADVMIRQGLDPARIEVIPNAPLRVGDAAPAEARADTARVLFAGRLSAEKGVDVLIDAVRATAGLELVVAGDGPEEAALRTRAEGDPRVRFTGRLGPADLARERAQAWAVAVPSLWYENAPLSVLEAFASGRPVLAAAHGGLLELVEDGATGWLVRPGDVAAWTASLGAMAADPEDAQRRGRAARRALEDRYGYAQFLDAYLAVYERLVPA